MIDGRRPATASPVIIAGLYSVRPKLAAKAKAEFWLRLLAIDVTMTAARVNKKYHRGPESKLSKVDTVKQTATPRYVRSDPLSRL